MTANAFSVLFALALGTNAVIRFWLAARQIRHVLAHRHQVPAIFAGRISLAAHQRAADYTVARVRVQLVGWLIGTITLLALTLFGGAQWLYDLSATWLGESPLAAQLLFLSLVMLVSSLVDLPLSWYRQFVLEKRFGFNRMTPALFVTDVLKGGVLAALIGLPLAALVLWIMQTAGAWWWIPVWLVWTAFTMGILVLYPTVIAPRFNRFEPMPDNPLRQRIEALLERCGFRSEGLFVMDGSRRSSHGNAYFTGFGRAKRIVFFDTLINRLDENQIEAVLAHELGHFKHRHIVWRMLRSFLMSLLGLALLGWLAQQAWFYTGLGMAPGAVGFEAPALLLFLLVAPVFTFLLRPVVSLMSRRDEFQADQFAASQTRPGDLADALLRLYEDNASTLTPDPIHSAFYDSHPSASERITRLTGAVAA